MEAIWTQWVVVYGHWFYVYLSLSVAALSVAWLYWSDRQQRRMVEQMAQHYWQEQQWLSEQATNRALAVRIDNGDRSQR